MTMIKWIAAALAIVFIYTNIAASQRYINIGIIIILIGIMLKNDVGGQLSQIMDTSRKPIFNSGNIYSGQVDSEGITGGGGGGGGAGGSWGGTAEDGGDGNGAGGSW